MLFSADYSEGEEDVVIGLKHDMKLLKARLLNNSKTHLNVISVLGIQGIGKTVLAWEVYRSSDVKSHFVCKAWVCASAMGNDTGEILKDIGEKVIGLQEDQETTTDDGHQGMQKKLCEFLKDKRYLIVIDDVPGGHVWNGLKEAFPNGEHGSRIMLTTRDVELAYLADSDGFPHRLWVLSAADSWELFTRKVYIAPWQVPSDAYSSATSHTKKYLDIPPQLVAIGRKMVKRCKGIPLLIVELADLVSSIPTSASEWSSVLHGVDMCLIGDDAHRWFNLSGFLCQMISSSHVKQGLPYLCGLFPTKIEIPARRFILSWAAEGLFFGQRYGAVAEEEVANDCLQQLLHFDIIRTEKVSSNGDAKTCSIPNDLPTCRVLRSNNAPNISCDDDHRCVWFHDPGSENEIGISESEDELDTAHPHPSKNSEIEKTSNINSYRILCSFWCFNFPAGYRPGQLVGRFLEKGINEEGGLQFLGVLDLEGVDKPCLPEAIGELINLRYLGLRETYLDTLPSSVGNLLKLQTLDTKRTSIRDYPESIQKLKILHHLHLNEGQYSSERVPWLSHLINLQTLSGVVVDESDLVKKDHGLCRLTNLRKLRFTCQINQQPRKDTVQGHWLEGLEHLRSLKVSAKDNKSKLVTIADLKFVTKSQELTNLYLLGRLNEQFDLHKFPENLTALTLSGSELTGDPMPKLEKLPKLQFLRLLSKSYQGQDMVCSSGGFGQLRVLRIWKLENLQRLTVKEGATPNIEELEIRYCDNMKELSRVPETLNELKLHSMPEEFTNKFVKYKVCRVVRKA